MPDKVQVRMIHLNLAISPTVLLIFTVTELLWVFPEKFPSVKSPCFGSLRPKLARKFEIKHWYACGADGRKVEWLEYGHVIAEFSRMERFSNLWGFELSA